MRPTARARRGAATEVARARRPGGATSTNAPFDARPASGRTGVRRPPVLDPRGALDLQRTAGNRATALALRPAPVVTARARSTWPAAARVSDHDSPGVNLRENVLTVMDRLRDLGELDRADYATESRARRRPPGPAVVPVAQLARPSPR